MICGYLTAQMILTTLCVIWKFTDTAMEHYYDKGILEWLDCGLAPPCPRIVLNNQNGPEQCCNCQRMEELGTWTLHFIGTSRGHSNYFFCYNQSYFIQAYVPLTFVTLLLLLLSHFSRVPLCVTPERAAHQASLSLGFSRQEHRSRLLFPSPMHESEK